MRVCHELLQLFFGNDFAVEQMHFPLGMLRKPWIVRHHADRRAFSVQIGEKLHHRFTVA